MIFKMDVPATPIYKCIPTAPRNTATCSSPGYQIPGFPTRATWTRQDDTPTVFYGRASHYDPGIMWATAIARGFEREYLQEFDCLITGFFINDVGRVAWVLHEEESHRCLVVDNARARDLYATVIHSRYALEMEYTFARDVLGNTLPTEPNPIVVVAYQVEEPTPKEWLQAERLDQWLYDKWETSYHGEPKGWIQIKRDHQTWYMIDSDEKEWVYIPGCLYCNEDLVYGWTGETEMYTIKSGDSLGSIAVQFFGYSHPRFWDAIYEANTDVMKTMEDLTVGKILEIPIWGIIPAE